MKGTVLIVVLLCVVSACMCFDRESLKQAGFVEEKELLHWTLTKEDHSVVIPFEEGDELVNIDWLMDQAGEESEEDKANPLRRSFYDFLPVQAGRTFENKTLAWTGECFRELSASVALTANNTATITINSSKKRTELCTEWYLFSTREHGYTKLLRTSGKHTITFDLLQYQQADILRNGVKVYLLPLGVTGTAVSILKTLELFMDPYPGMVDANVQFFHEREQWGMVERRVNLVNLTASDLKSGDMFAVLRMDGLDPMIAWGTGGRTGHTTMALWFGNELYIVESTDAEGGFLTYWPPPYGIIRTPFEQWKTQAMKANYNVAVTRLAPQYLSKFNETAANAWFMTVQGQPYGWHNFLFTFLDTVEDNLPRPITPDLFETVFCFLERLIPIDSKGSVYNMMIQGLNHRFNSNCKDLHCVFGILDPKGMSLSQAMTIPESDQWRYGGNYSMVCDVFVFEMYKQAGVIPWDIQATEQTPKDVYQMNIWDPNWKRPLACVEADPALPYCQLMGKYQLQLSGFNSISPYDKMNERCPSLPPVYYREPGC